MAADRARISKFAELHAQLNEGTTSLMGLLRDKTRSVAIVGNSPCELGSGKGPLVDLHDFVARFNLFSISEEFARDYGRKCSIHVRHPEIAYPNQELLASHSIVINRPDLIYRQRNWENVSIYFWLGQIFQRYLLAFTSTSIAPCGGNRVAESPFALWSRRHAGICHAAAVLVFRSSIRSASMRLPPTILEILVLRLSIRGRVKRRCSKS